MYTLLDLVVRRPVATMMLFLAALTFGWVSYKRLPVELMPDIGYPTITVRTSVDGAAPQEIESQISRPLEEALSTLDGLVSLESRSRPGSSELLLGFDWGTDMARASQTIRETLQTVWLPEAAERPLILRYDPSLEPFLRISLSIDPGKRPDLTGDAALYALREVAEQQVQRELEGMNGVAAVRVQGGLEREIRIEVREDWLAARKLTVAQVRQALAAENVNISGGSILDGDVEYLVRTLNQYRGVEELKTVRIRRPDGVLIPLTDVATLTEGHRERQLVTRMNGGEAVQLEILKEADSNVVEVARRVKEALEGEQGVQSKLPPGIQLQVVDDQAAFIELAIENVTSAAWQGGLLAIAVIFLFLRDFRTTAIIGLTIPTSVIIGFAPLYLLGVSLNVMTLGGLALGVGMLVDNAVVVIENVHRERAAGRDRLESVVKGTADVASAVIASTLTTVAVFAPITLVDGIAGELFGDLSLAVCSCLMSSLLVGMTLVPMLAALDPTFDADASELVDRMVREPGETRLQHARRLAAFALHDPWEDVRTGWTAARTRPRRVLGWLALPWVLLRALSVLFVTLFAVVWLAVSNLAVRFARTVARPVLGRVSAVLHRASDAFLLRYGRLEAGYGPLLERALRRPGLVMGLATAAMLVALSASALLGTELLPELHQGRFTIDLALPLGTPLDRTVQRVQDVEREIRAVPGVRSVYTTVGYDPRVDTRSDQGEHTAQLRVDLGDADGGAAYEDRVLERVREAVTVGLREVPAEITVRRPALFSFRPPIEIVFYGWDLDELRRAGDMAAERLQSLPSLVDVRSSLGNGQPEVRIVYDRERLHRLGLDPMSVAEAVRDKVRGVEASQIHRGDQRIAMLVQLVEPDRASVDELGQLNVNPQLIPPIPLASVATLEEGVGPSEIRRVDQQRAVVVSANLASFDLGGAARALRAELSELQFPGEIRWEVGGQSREMGESLGSLAFALGLAVFLVYVVMASTFESLLHPFVLLISIPLSVVGAVPLLWLADDPIGVMVLIGVIVLVGIVVNNGIVLVDAVGRMRAEGMGVHEALQQAGMSRLRPILITASTNVFGLVPLALGFGAGAEMQQPLAVTVIGGMTSSTLLTLVVVPVVYALAERLFSRSPPLSSPPLSPEPAQ
jgi:HAE1 family hydrophobic/amphiphilic exporter-1